MKRWMYFGLGAFTACAIMSASALAAQLQTIEATLNSVNIEVDGQKVATVGEGYILDNGKETAGSIVYNDTTYVPIRRFGEIMGAEIGWNQATGSVTVTGESGRQVSTTPAPDATTLSTDHLAWSEDEETAYQEFKGMWKVVPWESAVDHQVNYHARYNGGLDTSALIEKLQSLGESKFNDFCARFLQEISIKYNLTDNRSTFAVGDTRLCSIHVNGSEVVSQDNIGLFD